jgi:hypothetical protein
VPETWIESRKRQRYPTTGLEGSDLGHLHATAKQDTRIRITQRIFPHQCSTEALKTETKQQQRYKVPSYLISDQGQVHPAFGAADSMRPQGAN